MSKRRDGEEIVALLTRYATAVDTKDWQLLGNCFAQNAHFAFFAGTLEGRASIQSFMRTAHSTIDASRHRLSNITVTIDTSGSTARASTYLDALIVEAHHPGGHTFQIVGTYYDTLEKDADGWRIAGRRFDRLWSEGNAALLVQEQE